MDQELPNSIELEKFICGMLVTNPQTYFEIHDYINDSVFYDSFCCEIFKICKEFTTSGINYDINSILTELKKKDNSVTAYQLIQIVNSYAYSQDYITHAKQLFELSIRRKLILMYIEESQKIHDLNTDVFEQIEKISGKIRELTIVNKNDLKKIDSVVNDVINDAYERQKSEKEVFGIPYGFLEIDRKTKGRQPSDLTIIAGETSQGKTSFALNCALNIAKQGYKIGFISLEMSDKQLAARLMAIESSINSNTILNEKIEIEKLQSIEKQVEFLASLGIYIDNSGNSSIEGILNKIRIMKIKHNIDLCVIDYIQLIKCSTGFNREQQVAYIARSLKNLSKEINVPIDALSQLARNRDNPEPKMSRLRESGQIEEAADNVIFVFRPESYNKNVSFVDINNEFSHIDTKDKAQIIQAKGRNSGTNDWLLGFDRSLTRFYELNENTDFKELDVNSSFDINPF